MRPAKEWRKRFLISSLTFLALSSSSKATVLVNPPSPLKQYVMGDANYTIYYGGSNLAAPSSSGFYNSTEGYRFINTLSNDAADPGNLIWLDVSTNKKLTVNSGQHIVVTLSTGGSSTGIVLKGAGVVTTNIAPPTCNAPACQGTAGFFSASYNPGSVLRISFSITDLCSGATGSLCNLSGVTNYQNFGTAGATLTQPINVIFSVVDNYSVTGAVSGENTDSGSFILGVTNIPPTVTCPALNDAYFPGDRQIYVNPSQFASSVGVGDNSMSGIDLKYLVFLAGINTQSPFTANAVPSNEIVAYVDVTKGAQAIDGFTNTTDNSNNSYTGRIYAQNSVGIVSPLHPSCEYLTSIRSQAIQGVLTESKCFIATAAYQDGRAAPVMMLRRFRDRILAKSALGRKFIEKYYRYSPALAAWAWDKPWVRSLALRALAPIELLAWASLKLIPDASAEETSPQPYIDRLKAQMKKTEPENAGSQESYTEELKKKLGLKPAPQGESPYIDRVKSGLEPVPSAEGYTDQERAKLPPIKDQESLIERVKAGRDKLPEESRPPIKEAIGFMVGVSPGLEVVNTSGTKTFTEIYGAGWKPELTLHYERQIFHSEYAGSFGLGVDLGISIANGYGQLTFPFNGTSASQTPFTFFQVPVLASAYYRFNLLRVLRPYVGGSVGPILFSEVRSDPAPDRRSYSFVYVTHLGAALLLDFLDRATAKDSYLSLGVQHSYLFVEFLYQNSFNQTGVVFSRSGIYSGFLFEI